MEKLETRTLTSMHVYHSRLSFASLTLIAVVLVDSSAATRYSTVLKSDADKASLQQQ